MILQALNSYYERLAEERDGSGTPKVPSYGFSKEQVAYILILSSEGKPLDAIAHMTRDKKPRPKLMTVPKPEKRAGKPSDKNMKPSFLWDKTSYALGIELEKDKAAVRSWTATEKTFTAFRDYHLRVLEGTEDAGLRALKLFLQRWQPQDFAESRLPEAIAGQNLVFQLDGDQCYLHQRPAAKMLWQKLLHSDREKRVPCLVSGEMALPARLHPAIKGVWNVQSSGGSIVSFNQESFGSYGKVQGDNAPVSQKAAFAYTTALNYLLNRAHRQCVQIGDASTVFWAVSDQAGQAEAAEMLCATFISPPDDATENHKLSALLTDIAKGRALAEIRPNLDSSTRFYVLGLAPNAARISIRFWLQSTLGELATRFAEHYDDLSITPSPWRKVPAIQDLLEATAVQSKKKNISPLLAGELMRAILAGTPYPMSLLAQLLLRVRTYAYKNKKNKKNKKERDLNGYRIAMIKAILARRYRKNLIQEEVPMALDKDNRNGAYLLGRLFAVLERIQGQALGELNAGISERYYGSASMAPFSVFPRLLRGARHHLGKLRKDRPGSAVYLDKALGEVIGHLPESSLPRHLSIDDQGRFAIGYYQQKQRYFEKKSETREESA